MAYRRALYATVCGGLSSCLLLFGEPRPGNRQKEGGVEKVIISAAITGGMTVPGQSAAIPVTPEEIIESAVGAHGAGATIVHLHVREPETGKPSSDIGLLRGGGLASSEPRAGSAQA